MMFVGEHKVKKEPNEDCFDKQSSSRDSDGSLLHRSTSQMNNSTNDTVVLSVESNTRVHKDSAICVKQEDSRHNQESQTSSNNVNSVSQTNKRPINRTVQNSETIPTKRGRKKFSLSQVTCPIPIQPRILPRSPTVINSGTNSYSSVPNQITSLNSSSHGSPVVKVISVPSSNTQVAQLKPVQLQSTSSANDMLHKSGQNSIIIQVFGNQSMASLSKPVNQLVCSSTNSVPQNSLSLQLPGYPATLDRSVASQLQFSHHQPAQTSSLNAACTLQIQLPSGPLAQSLEISQNPVISGQSLQGPVQNHIQIIMPSCKEVATNSRNLGGGNNPSGHTVTSIVKAPIPLSVTSNPSGLTNSRIPVQIQISNPAAAPKNSRLVVQALKSSLVPKKPKGAGITCKRLDLKCTVGGIPQLKVSLGQKISTNTKAGVTKNVKNTLQNEFSSKQSISEFPLKTSDVASSRHALIQPTSSGSSNFVTVPLQASQTVENGLTRGGRKKYSPIKRGPPVPIRPKVLPCSQKDVEVQVSASDFPGTVDFTKPNKLDVASVEMVVEVPEPLEELPHLLIEGSPVKKSSATETVESFGYVNSLFSIPVISHQESSSYRTVGQLELSCRKTGEKLRALDNSNLNMLQQKHPNSQVMPESSRSKPAEWPLLQPTQLCKLKPNVTNGLKNNLKKCKDNPQTQKSLPKQMPVTRFLIIEETTSSSLCSKQREVLPHLPTTCETLSSKSAARTITIIPENEIRTLNETDSLFAVRSVVTSKVSDLSNVKITNEKQQKVVPETSLFAEDRNRSIIMSPSSANIFPELKHLQSTADALNPAQINAGKQAEQVVPQPLQKKLKIVPILPQSKSKFVPILPQSKSKFVPILPRPADNHMCIYSQTIEKKREFWGVAITKEKLTEELKNSDIHEASENLSILPGQADDYACIDSQSIKDEYGNLGRAVVKRKRKEQELTKTCTFKRKQTSDTPMRDKQLLDNRECFVQLEMLKVEPHTTYFASDFL